MIITLFILYDYNNTHNSIDPIVNNSPNIKKLNDVSLDTYNDSFFNPAIHTRQSHNSGNIHSNNFNPLNIHSDNNSVTDIIAGVVTDSVADENRSWLNTFSFSQLNESQTGGGGIGFLDTDIRKRIGNDYNNHLYSSNNNNSSTQTTTTQQPNRNHIYTSSTNKQQFSNHNINTNNLNNSLKKTKKISKKKGSTNLHTTSTSTSRPASAPSSQLLNLSGYHQSIDINHLINNPYQTLEAYNDNHSTSVNVSSQ